MKRVRLRSSKFILVLFLVIMTFGLIKIAFADSVGPIFSDHKPADGSVTDNPTPVISVTVRDLEGIDQNSRTMTIDGNPVSTRYYPANLYDSNGNYIGSDSKKGEISYYESTKPLSDGPHEIVVSIADKYQNRSTTKWTFTVDAKPQYTGLSPAARSYVTSNTPLITAKIVDTNIDPLTVVLKVDGDRVQHSFDPATGIVSYRPAVPLDEGNHIVSISASDTNGNSNSVNWEFKIDSLKPVFYDQTPNNGVNLVNSFTNISVLVHDSYPSSNINKDSLIFKLNGQKVPASIKYGGYWLEDFWVEEDPTNAIIEFDANNLPDKINTVFVSIADMAGNTSTADWTFTVNSPPAITEISPARNARVTSLQPVISAKITDNDELDPEHFTLNVNGKTVAAAFDHLTGILSYTPQSPLPQEDYTTVNLTVYDKGGNYSRSEWRFYAYTYANEMPTPNDSNKCDTCHGSGFDVDNPVRHPMNKCVGCHYSTFNNYMVIIPECYKCHYYKGPEFPYHTESNWWNSYGTPTFGSVVRNGYVVKPHPNSPAIVLSCNYCHDNNNYDLIPKHNDPFKVALRHKSPTRGCDKCHATTLTREHVMRRDDNNNTLTCETCHLNPPVEMADKVKKAIADKNASCDGCHTLEQMLPQEQTSSPHPDHTVTTQYSNSGCQSCHLSNNLAAVQQHLTGGLCTICHASTQENVINAIAGKNKDCSACHTLIHDNVGTLHLSSYVVNPQLECSSCHENKLNIEHMSKLDKDGQPINCYTCHTSTRDDVKLAVATGNTNCDACHTIHTNPDSLHISGYVENPQVDCARCHDSALNIEHANRADDSGRAYDCKTCHNSTDTRVKEAIASGSTGCTACHTTIHTNVTEPHLSTYMSDPPLDCSGCHTNVLHNEHAGRTDSTGKSMNCNTCHTSSRDDVKLALVTKNTKCDACHAVHPEPDSIHTSGYMDNPPLNCSSCHDSILNAEHASHLDDSGSPYDCKTCHNSKNTQVKNAISNSNTNCDACHTIHTNPDSLHISSYVENPQVDCASCHTNVLYNEHAGKTDSTGKAMDCNTCHASGRDDVKLAVVTKNTNCDACHTFPALLHEPQHTVVEYDTDPARTVDCAGCHTTKDLKALHVGLQNNKTGQTMTCNSCHGINADPVVKNVIKLNTKPGNTANTQAAECSSCHNGSASSVGLKSVHEAVDHSTDFLQTSLNYECNTCHKSTLDEEHLSRTGSNGQKYSCGTCHNSADKDVQSAIKIFKNTECSACHNTLDIKGHPKHQNNLDDACQTCHSTSLLSEEKYHSKNSCKICHGDSVRPEIKNAISGGRTACYSCHESSKQHRIKFKEEIPSDIPLYEKLYWSTPQNAEIWADEPWMDSEFALGGKIVIAERSSSITGQEVWEFYRRELGKNGWQLVSPEPTGNYFKVTFVKDTIKKKKKCSVWFFGYADHDSGPLVKDERGQPVYRVEILYTD